MSPPVHGGQSLQSESLTATLARPVACQDRADASLVAGSLDTNLPMAWAGGGREPGLSLLGIDHPQSVAILRRFAAHTTKAAGRYSLGPRNALRTGPTPAFPAEAPPCSKPCS